MPKCFNRFGHAVLHILHYLGGHTLKQKALNRMFGFLIVRVSFRSCVSLLESLVFNR